MKKNVLFSLLIAVTVFSCNEEFLDPVRNSNVLTTLDVSQLSENNPALVEGSLAGISGFMIEPGGVTGGRHYDLGQKGVDIWMDMACSDMALSASAYGWYNDLSNMLTTVDFTQEENEIIWNYYYKVVNLANTVIQTTGGNNADPDSDEVRYVHGQARAFRAYAYFYLTQLFQREYNPTEEILPFYDGETAITSKVAASEFYNLMISDLMTAIDFLDGFNRTQKNQIDKTVAQGLLAYVYAAMGNYADAKTMADMVINSGYPLATNGQLAYPGSGSGFNDITSPNWIWGSDITAELDHVLINWWGQIDYFTYSYAWAGDTKSIDDALFAQIPSDDVRKDQFGTGASPLQPVNKFFDPGRAAGGQFVITTDYIFMRVEEFYLLSAEAAAKTGDEATAKNRLRDLLEVRLDGGLAAANSYLSPLSGQSLIDEIYFQTRIELWGEGKSYLAMKRNAATVTRGTNHVFRAGETFSYNSDELSFQIPQVEINNNPNISSQNN